MSSEPSETPEVRTIRHLVRLMQKYDLTAIDLGDGPNKIRLRRRGAETVAASAAAVASIPIPPSATTPTITPAAPPTLLAATPAGAVIESPMVGTFYSSSGPDSPPFVAPGSTVRAETIVCIIEAMKVFTEIPAGIAGTIAECLVKTGQAVEFGQPMFLLKP